MHGSCQLVLQLAGLVQVCRMNMIKQDFNQLPAYARSQSYVCSLCSYKETSKPTDLHAQTHRSI